MCVGLSRWTEGQHGWNKVTTETRVSKLGGLNQETLHFQVALIQGYHINLTLLSERPHGRKWVEGRDLESTSQTSSASTQGEVCTAAASACQMARKSELLEISEDHVHTQAWYIRMGATVTEWPHTSFLLTAVPTNAEAKRDNNCVQMWCQPKF